MTPLLLKMWALESPSSNPVSLVGRSYGVGILFFITRDTAGDTIYFGEVLRQEGADVPDLSGELSGLHMGLRQHPPSSPACPCVASSVSGSLSSVPFRQALSMGFSHHMIQVVFTSIPCSLGFPPWWPVDSCLVRMTASHALHRGERVQADSQQSSYFVWRNSEALPQALLIILSILESFRASCFLQVIYFEFSQQLPATIQSS